VSIFEINSLFNHHNINGVTALGAGVAEVEVIYCVQHSASTFIRVKATTHRDVLALTNLTAVINDDRNYGD
jgi:hypothetical protein